MELHRLYQLDAVRQRMREYLGAVAGRPPTALFVSRCDRGSYQQIEPLPVAELDRLLERGQDAARSLWDRAALLAHLDVEYVNFDFPGEPFLDPVRAFYLQEPVRLAAERVLAGHRLRPLWLLSGRGYHLIWQVPRNSQAFALLAGVGRVPEHLLARYARPQPPAGAAIDPDTARAYAGLGMVMEHLARSIQRLARPHSAMPVELTAQRVAPQQVGREMISIDVSEYADPLDRRMIRLPFSAYRKPWENGSIRDAETRQRIPLMVMVPLDGQTPWPGLAARRFLEPAADLAQRTSTRIPDQAAATERLVGDYTRSRLARFHRDFYARQQQPPERWPQTYDRFSPASLPADARLALEQANDQLLKPERLRALVRAMLQLGWHPRDVAGLIRSKYERDHGWGGEWYTYDAATRADFYTRLFAGGDGDSGREARGARP
jgi:hypothetical protein